MASLRLVLLIAWNIECSAECVAYLRHSEVLYKALFVVNAATRAGN
jgi:hypothetical protein